MIYYFSGTGNSKWVAGRLASILGEHLVEIGEAIRLEKFRYELATEESIGWVFPVYSWGPPPVVLDFISKWHVDGYVKGKTYCYMVAVCGDEDEPGLTCASRELEEETGYRSENLEWLITLRTTVAFCNEKIEVYVAKDLIPSRQHLDEDEFIDLKAYSLDDLKEKIFSGEIEDAKTVASLMAYAAKYGK